MSDSQQKSCKFSATGIVPGVTVVLVALLITQISLLFRGMEARGQLHDINARVTEVKEALVPMVAEVQEKETDIQADRQMVVDLTRTLVQIARAGNITAQEMLPLVQNDLQQLELRIQLDSLD